MDILQRAGNLLATQLVVEEWVPPELLDGDGGDGDGEGKPSRRRQDAGAGVGISPPPGLDAQPVPVPDRGLDGLAVS